MFHLDNDLTPWLTKEDGLSGKWLQRFQTQSTVESHMKKKSECKDRNEQNKTAFKRIVLHDKPLIEKQKSEYT